MNTSSTPDGKHFLLALLVAATVFACVAPTLRWPQLTGGNENIVIQTALEIRRGGPWLVPNMLGEPRIKKPPLVAWITALTMDQRTLDQLDDPLYREQAYVDLAWQVRWTGLLAGCVTIVATFFLGKALFDSRLGLWSAMVVATSILFQKYMRQSTSDVHLAMWVTIANACLAFAILRKRVWTGLIGASVATGLAFLCKGPVALLETVLPAICMCLPVGIIKTKIHRPCDHENRLVPDGVIPQADEKPQHRKAIVVATGIFALIALPWFIYVYLTVPQVASTWTTELSRQGATGLGPDPVYAYLLRIPMNWPWIVMLVVGFFVMIRARTRADLYTLAMLLIPIAIMTFVPDRKERYLLPFVAPAAILCARGIVEVLRSFTENRWIVAIHWVVLASVCIGLPLAGAYHPDMVRVDGTPWYPAPLAWWIVTGFASLILLGISLQKYFRPSFVVVTWVAVLGLQAVVTWAYADTPSGRSPLKVLANAIRTQAPGAKVYDFDEEVRADEELAIYLNRTIVRADPKTLTPSDVPVVFVTRKSRDEPDIVAPAGWSFIAKVQERKNEWWAFVLREKPGRERPG